MFDVPRCRISVHFESGMLPLRPFTDVPSVFSLLIKITQNGPCSELGLRPLLPVSLRDPVFVPLFLVAHCVVLLAGDKVPLELVGFCHVGHDSEFMLDAARFISHLHGRHVSWRCYRCFRCDFSFLSFLRNHHNFLVDVRRWKTHTKNQHWF